MKEPTEELVDLLLQRATVGLSAAEEGKLHDLLEREGYGHVEDIELAVAAAANAFALAESDVAEVSAPAHLKARLAADADRFFDQQETTASVTDIAAIRKSKPAGGHTLRHHLGWAAAATLAIALFITTRIGIEPVPSEIDPVTARAQLIEAVPTTTVIPWARPEIDEYVTVTGDVAWNDELQQGYLRLKGMPANDPAQSQYQLWIVDSDRDANPVDGGVFDIPTGGGEIIIPIDAKLRVSSPEAFAITREKPGGVVVSAGPLLVVAAAS